MVPVNLIDLVAVPNTRHLWPEQFAGLVATCEEASHERTAFGVVADWVEQEAGEPQYAAAWRWLMRRPEVAVEHYRPGTWESSWRFEGLPEPVAGIYAEGDAKTLAGRVAVLAEQLRRLRAHLE